jgi:dTDP-4-amino-4,6-dideoxy-D-galactose acyltransferase
LPTRTARLDESELIAAISASNRNANDRFHADPAFGSAIADEFLAEYARAAVRGYCDEVIVPEQPEVVDSFLAINYLESEAQVLGIGLGRVVLTAVGSRNRGWHRPLVAETLYRVRERGGEVVFMTTQAANAAVINNAQRLGFALGGVTQLFSLQPIGRWVLVTIYNIVYIFMLLKYDFYLWFNLIH